ncbi:META domain-containing protein [Streptomyces sp. WAC05374]|uniref:META domain-containing protein n=1 Tax=Streptomyces sp. WAC05374 TaxID=2487420 RepID=UPI000F87819A|nr:META domain-containing protein [Streptomyces sp. WAC05374]RST13794.1 META domain-containing protein [Streptomyces sp. WAC05374]TDF36139.1 META domain-containing protein [Streptomyces sp. WAC05374]TDF45093.1 META domain-containing protein [Streptomyces sp. WAC05374]TDF56498.1 META domain-containing protein [Streptomyces sp. WAC05374]
MLKKPPYLPGAAAALVPLLALGLTACGTQSGDGSGPGDGSGSVRPDVPVTGVHWTVESVTVDGRKTAAPAGAHVRIDPKGRAMGNFGCNHFNARATVDGDTVTLSDAAMTEMGCPEPLQGFEDALKSTLTGKLKAELTDGKLTLTTPDGDAIRLGEQPPAPLVGTTWTVDSLVSGRAATSLPAGTEGKASFVFGKDGSVRGNLGCNQFSAPVTTDGSTLTFGRVTSTRKLCPGPAMELERALLNTMKGKVTYAIDHRSLTVTAPGGTGFAAGAESGGKGAR